MKLSAIYTIIPNYFKQKHYKKRRNMIGKYKIVVGCPNLRVYKGDIVVSSNSKPLLFNGFDESTVLNLNASTLCE